MLPARRRASAGRTAGPRARSLLEGAQRRLLRAWRRLDDYRLLRDVLSALVLAAVVLASLSAATGGAWPPMLVVESGSMMHATSETPYGRIGTADVGDILFLRKIGPDEIRLWVDGGEERYGRPGSVVSFARNGDRENTTVIHRAITFVTVERTEEGPRYTLRWIDGETLTFGAAGIYFPPLGFDERYGFTPTTGYRPHYSGYITKGDNRVTNPAADQALGISALVDPSWIEGEVRGEVPWLGLGKLALQNGRTNPNVPGWERVGNAFAPVELWTMFFLVLALVVLVPFALDTLRMYRLARERAAAREAEEAERAREEMLRPRPPTRRPPVELVPVRR